MSWPSRTPCHHRGLLWIYVEPHADEAGPTGNYAEWPLDVIGVFCNEDKVIHKSTQAEQGHYVWGVLQPYATVGILEMLPKLNEAKDKQAKGQRTSVRDTCFYAPTDYWT